MSNLANVLKESYDELVHNVSWPSFRELSQTAVLVLVASLIIAVLVFAMDQLIKWILFNFIY
ncbi:MAG: preprotein translocase subunit SecE [Paludibacteraceae bacterium]|jgi:preprotein translocase subunit SecE|nr:preprotein translocase subunit SecE [Bacteroidaceae bacterium]MBR6041606.1 preprotein translocase subunit SecE [Paludibacteraceae bacterium]MBR6106354.1 preprotein translocase subunit SecE [Paludibacteraceae bacterium]